MCLTLAWHTKFSSIAMTCATSNSLNKALVENYSQTHLNRLGTPMHLFPSCATREPAQWDLAYSILTTLSTTFDVTELLLRSQKMLPAHPFEGSLYPAALLLPKHLSCKGLSIFQTSYPNAHKKPRISRAHRRQLR